MKHQNNTKLMEDKKKDKNKYKVLLKAGEVIELARALQEDDQFTSSISEIVTTGKIGNSIVIETKDGKTYLNPSSYTTQQIKQQQQQHQQRMVIYDDKVICKNLQLLPYIQSLHANDDILQQITLEFKLSIDLDETIGLGNYINDDNLTRNSDVLLSLKDAPHRCLLDLTKDLINNYIQSNPDKHSLETPILFSPKLIGILRDEYDKVKQQTTKLINRHYRKYSIQIHPDRHGEEHRDKFEALTNARDCLKDESLRRLYVDQMLDVVRLVGSGLILSSHNSWVEKNRPDIVDDTRTGRKNRNKTTTNNGSRDQHHNGADVVDKPLQLRGGISQDKPRLAQIETINTKDRHIRLTIPVLEPIDQFYEYADSVRVYATCSEKDQQRVIIKLSRDEILSSRDELPSINNSDCTWNSDYHYIDHYSLTMEAYMPWHSTWYIKWNASLMVNGSLIQTPYSHEVPLQLLSEKQLRANRLLEELPVKEKLALQRAGDIKSLLRKLDSPSQHIDVDKKYNMLHSVVVKGRALERSLRRLLNLKDGGSHTATSMTSSSSLHNNRSLKELQIALSLTIDKKSSLEAMRDTSLKKSALKDFKQYIIMLLEAGDSPSWIESATEADLKKHGGDANRLYQLFTEGRGVSLLELDTEMLENASKRTDLFSDKQCSAIQKRKDEIEAEEERQAEERKKLEAEEQKIEEMKVEAMKSLIGRNVQLIDLHDNNEDFNHQIGRVDGLSSDRNRYDVYLYKTDKTVPVKRESFVLYHYNPDEFTYKNGERDADEANKNREVSEPSHGPKEGSPSPRQPSVLTNGKIHNESMTTKNQKQKQTDTTMQKPNARIIVQKQPVTKTMSTLPFQNNKGSKKAAVTSTKRNPNQPIVKYIDRSTVRFIVGKRGKNVIEIERQSGAHVSIDDDRNDETKSIMRVTGDDDAVEKALKLIKMVVERKGGNLLFTGSPIVTTTSASATPTPAHNQRHRVVTPSQEQQKQATDKNVDNMKSKSASPAISTIQPQHHVVTPSKQQQQQPTDKIFNVKSASASAATIQHHVVTPSKQQQRQPTENTTPPQMTTPSNKPSIPDTVSFYSTATASTESTNIMIPTLSSHPIPLSQEQQTPSKTKTSLKKNSGNFVEDNFEKLLRFLETQKACIKGSPIEFGMWLKKSEDIMSLDDLAEAMSDNTYVKETLQQGNGKLGLKGFKRSAFKKALIDAADEEDDDLKPFENNIPAVSGDIITNAGGKHGISIGENSAMNDYYFGGIAELCCPISCELMTDPVVAADSVTYERSAIENWFETSQQKIAMAQLELTTNPNSTSAQEIVDRGVCSPMLPAMKLPHLLLTPNNDIRALACDHAKSVQQRKLKHNAIQRLIA